MSNENSLINIRELFFEILQTEDSELSINNPAVYLANMQIRGVITADEAHIVRKEISLNGQRLELWTRIVPRKGIPGLQQTILALQSINFNDTVDRLCQFCARHNITILNRDTEFDEEFKKLTTLYYTLIQTHLKTVKPSNYFTEFAIYKIISESELERLKSFATSDEQRYELWIIILLGRGKKKLKLIAKILKTAGYVKAYQAITDFYEEDNTDHEDGIINEDKDDTSLLTNLDLATEYAGRRFKKRFRRYGCTLLIFIILSAALVVFGIKAFSAPVRPSVIFPISTTPSAPNFSIDVYAKRLVGMSDNTLAIIHDFELTVIDANTGSILSSVPTNLSGYSITDISYNHKHSVLFVIQYTNLNSVHQDCVMPGCNCDPRIYLCNYRRSCLTGFYWNSSTFEIKNIFTRYWMPDRYVPVIEKYSGYLDRITTYSGDFVFINNNVSVTDFMFYRNPVLVSTVYRYNFLTEYVNINVTCHLSFRKRICNSLCCGYDFPKRIDAVDIASYNSSSQSNADIDDDELLAVLLSENITYISVMRFKNGDKTGFNFVSDNDLKKYGKSVAIAFTENGNILIATQKPDSIVLLTLLNIYENTCCALMLPASPVDITTVGSYVYVAFGKNFPIQAYSVPTKCGCE